MGLFDHYEAVQCGEFAFRMLRAVSPTEGRWIIGDFERALNAAEVEAGLKPSVGPGGSGFHWRGFSTLSKREMAEASGSSSKLAALVADGVKMEKHWKVVFARREEPHYGNDELADDAYSLALAMGFEGRHDNRATTTPWCE
jgi:hypothetical protein